jgi:SAM-dependent methyltransferase
VKTREFVTRLGEMATTTVSEVDDGKSRVLFGGADPRITGHIADDCARLELFYDVICASAAGDVLDVGANPYLLTYALSRAGKRVVATGVPMGDDVQAARASVTFEGATSLDVPLWRFSADRSPYPFADASFDAVVVGELLEHLPAGPAELLYECNRVLRPGGLLLLSTPNAVSLAQLYFIARRQNPHWPFSSQGVYARHNRLYTFDEIDDLLQGNGFARVIARGITRSVRREWYAPSASGAAKWAVIRGGQRLLQSRPHALRKYSEGMFIVGRKTAGPEMFRPPWLFDSADTVPMRVAD